ncbi:response regulator transcription factor [Flaviaesturariibacter aridisoli]|uniref:Response regulator transcription factor n=1 Tax=Flaviaesturariibacter aridisoli TaxID=2545761 RepID=A0A4V2WMJ3_9BACT|nr:response regulator transcription factor [Flaviaesturariibacter aridisoli]TCZ70132.1 response regulator transcription factor [Flaviaesturariibacter aridisoli]
MEAGKILLVEDERKIADTLRVGLAEHGFDTTVAYDGPSGLQAFTDGAFDLAVLDINLPGLSGYQLCQEIRNSDTHIPVIMLTALSSLNDKIEGYDAGADDYVVKPFEFRELLMKIRVLLKRTQGQAPPVSTTLRADDLEMQLDRKEVRRNGQVIHLTAKEFQLLEYLLRHKNRVVSRADIALNVWEIDFDTNTNVIDVYINYLRNKVDKPFAYKLIHTQVGMGYILKENS